MGHRPPGGYFAAERRLKLLDLHLHNEIFAAVIWWHRPYELKNFEPSAKYAPCTMRYVCVGADSIRPVVSPWGNNVGAMRRQCTTEHLQMKFGGIMLKHGIFATSEPRFGQYGSAQKFATLAGGYYPLYYGVIAPGDHWILIPCGLHHPYADCATELPARKSRSAVGADTSRPVVSPWGKQRRRKAPTIQFQTFANEIRWYHVETWYICNIGTPVWPIRFCPKICHVGGRLIAVELWCDRPRRSGNL